MPTASPYSGELREKLDEYRRLGQEEASSHRPPADASRADRHEAAIISDGQQWLASEKKTFQAELTSSSAAAVQLAQECTELPARLDRVLADELLPTSLAAAQTEHKPKLVAAAVTRLKLETDLRSLREKNNIGDQASYPDSHIWHFAIIALLALAETVINAFFYENSQGLIGGFAVALGVSVVNMSSALVLGIGFRYKNVVAPLRKIAGMSCFVAFAALSVYCNALFSAFRAEYQLLTDPSDPMQLRQAFTLATTSAARVFTLNMHFADLMSFILFGFGFLLSCFAFYKGYTFDDKYPGHGERHRAVRTITDTETARRNEVREELKVLAHQYRRDVQAAQSAPGELVSRAGSRASQLQIAKETLGRQALAIERDLKLVLETYRSANSAIRATEPPAYFSDFPKLVASDFDDVSAALRASLERVQHAAHEIGEAFQSRLNAKLNLVAAQGLAVDKGFDEFLQLIDSRAKQHIDE